MTRNNLGAFFEEAYECPSDVFDKVLSAFGEPHHIDVIYHDDQVTVTRLFTQVESGKIRGYNAMYVAQLEDTDRYIITSGTIRTSRSDKVPEYEKVGKRLLYRATKELWNAHY